MREKILFLGLFLAVVAASGCVEEPAPSEMTCEEHCSMLPHIACVGHWEVGGEYPDCQCEFVCDTGEEVPVVQCIGEGQPVPVVAEPRECCPGLDLIPPKDQQILGISGYCTANCGDGVCDTELESAHNCPADCE